MKALTKYEADDGTLHDTELAAQQRDVLVAQCRRIEALLPLPKALTRIDNNQRIRHGAERIAAYKYELVVLCRALYPTQDIFKHEPASIHPFSSAGRFLDDAGPGCVRSLWFRLMCCDAEHEYEQPFYALNPREWSGETLTG